MCPMKPTTKIRFNEPQIAFVLRAQPNCNLDGLTELSFEFDQAGEIIDCTGTIKDGGNINHDYTGSGLARLYKTTRRQFTAPRQIGATILQFPNGRRPWPPVNCHLAQPGKVGCTFSEAFVNQITHSARTSGLQLICF
jgi:hypothetical protein